MYAQKNNTKESISEIEVILSSHAIERFKERMKVDYTTDELIDKLNEKLKEGFIRKFGGEKEKYILGFEGQNFFFLLHNIYSNRYIAITFEWRLMNNYPEKKVHIKYS
ncbi:MAG: hypothetical protein ACP5LP_03825 [Candidatus Micrarchaeia archaeon]